MFAKALEGNDLFNLLKNLWGGIGVPGMVVPTLDTNELQRRISELKTVEGWLKTNLGLLQTTIQAMEMQHSTLQMVQGIIPTTSNTSTDNTNADNISTDTPPTQKTSTSDAKTITPKAKTTVKKPKIKVNTDTATKKPAKPNTKTKR